MATPGTPTSGLATMAVIFSGNEPASMNNRDSALSTTTPRTGHIAWRGVSGSRMQAMTCVIMKNVLKNIPPPAGRPAARRTTPSTPSEKSRIAVSSSVVADVGGRRVAWMNAPMYMSAQQAESPT